MWEEDAKDVILLMSRESIRGWKAVHTTGCKRFRIQDASHSECQRLDLAICFVMKMEMVGVGTRNLVRQNKKLADTSLLIYCFQGYRGGCMSNKALSSLKIPKCSEFL